MSKERINKLVTRALEIDKQIESMKGLYKELDAIVLELKDLDFRSMHVADTTVSLVDNFQKSNVVFRAHGIRRYELSINYHPGIAMINEKPITSKTNIDYEALPATLRNKYKR